MAINEYFFFSNKEFSSVHKKLLLCWKKGEGYSPLHIEAVFA